MGSGYRAGEGLKSPGIRDILGQEPEIVKWIFALSGERRKEGEGKCAI